MNNELKVKIKTLTPLWTGGVGGTVDRIHETGIIGSLRWWGEAVLRSRGGSACDPSEHTCPDKEGRYCDACAVFGTTGLKRSFSIGWDPQENPKPDQRLTIKVQGNRGWYLNRALLLKDHPGHLSVVRSPTPQTSAEGVKQFLALLLRIASDWGGMGARTQQGYGVVHVTTEPELDLAQAVKLIQDLQNRSKRKSPSEVGQSLPRLDEFFFAKVQIELQGDPKDFIKSRTTEVKSDQELEWYLNENILPLAPIVRYHLRQLMRQQILYNKGKPNAVARWHLMGVLNARYHESDFGKVEAIEWRCPKCSQTWLNTPPRSHTDGVGRSCRGRAKEVKWKCDSCSCVWELEKELREETKEIERQKSLIHVSHAYWVSEGIYEFRIWGWIPPELPGGVSREDVLSKLQEWLGVGKPSSQGFQKAQDGELWDASRLNLEAPSVLWLETPTLEELVQGAGGSPT